MRCSNCNIEIPPEWKHTITQNSCPACGGEIMNEAMKTLLDELREALTTMPNDPEGLAGWLLSHYELRKVGTGEPVQKFFGAKTKKKKTENDVEEDEEDIDETKLKVGTSAVQKFFQQAGIKPPKKRSPNAIVEQINGMAGADYGDMDEYTQQALKAMSEGVDPSIIRRASQNIEDEDLSGSSEDLHPALQMERLERLKKQQELQLGGSVGKIRRSE